VKRHVFSLHRVLGVRTTQESMARQRLAAALVHARRVEEEYDDANRRYQANLAAQASLRGSGMNLVALRDLDAMRARRVVDAERVRTASYTAVDDARAGWADAKKKLGALERLDERERELHAHELLAEQDAEVDDIVTTRHRSVADDTFEDGPA
jgi:flagellar export protein FliJ